jgi:DNA-binding NarL/FixJ family response regulator
VIRVLIADDQPLVRAGLRTIIDAQSDLLVVGEACDGRDVIASATRLRPDVIVMDIRMPSMDGIEATRRLTADDPPARVLVLTTFDLDAYVYDSLRAGASGFLLKDTPPAELTAAIRVVAAGDALIAPSITRRLIEAFVGRTRPTADAVRRVAELSPREQEVLGLLARGRANAEIAASLVVGENTVKSHVAHIFDKLGARNRVEATIIAYENGLVGPDPG